MALDLLKLAKNKAKIKAFDGPTRDDGSLDLREFEPKFRGFDANKPDRYYGYATYLIKKLGQFPEHDIYLNSHGSEPDYRSMLRVWRTCEDQNTLTEEEADKIIEAGRRG